MKYKPLIGKGDDGLTDLKGKRIKKSSDLILLNALIDEINALISVLIVREKKLSFLSIIHKFNSAFMSFNCGYKINDLNIYTDTVEKFVRSNSDLNIKNFVYFTKNDISSFLNVIRTRIRIAEVYAWKAGKKKTAVYLNRLSDMFFILALKYENNQKITTSFPEL